MNAETEPQHFRWSIGSSIAEELDFAMYAVRGRFLGGEFPVEYGSLLRTVPPIWRVELDALLGEPGGTHGVLEPAAFLAGTLLDDDYSRATLAIRELSAEAALERLRETAQQMGAEPDLSLPFEPRLADLFGRMEDRTFREAGFAAVEDESQIRRRREELLTVARLLAGGDLHARFWHWLDRFYYELYRPWRASQAGHLEDLERRARVALGSSEGGGQPDLSWLPPQNPLKMRPGLFDYVRSHGARLHFWVEPFGVADSFAILPGLVLVSFATPGAIYENFQAFAEDVAKRAAALADPTRLIILRLIRQYGLINTEIATYLGLARPTVSVHARILREAGLIRSSQEGRLVRHEMVPAEVRRLFRDLQRVMDIPEDDASIDEGRENNEA